mmetsp:Transcript_2777/g.6582  ORF Transcript_2777/g.6582 Transcript_2777/m.6582 type:complete len:230 (-) Transcript_2777:467-1156(-)
MWQGLGALWTPTSRGASPFRKSTTNPLLHWPFSRNGQMITSVEFDRLSWSLTAMGRMASRSGNGAMLAEFMASTRAPPTFSSSSMPRVWAPCRWTRLHSWMTGTFSRKRQQCPRRLRSTRRHGQSGKSLLAASRSRALLELGRSRKSCVGHKGWRFPAEWFGASSPASARGLHRAGQERACRGRGVANAVRVAHAATLLVQTVYGLWPRPHELLAMTPSCRPTRWSHQQ